MSNQGSSLMSGYGDFPGSYSGVNGDDPMTRWYTQEEPWNSVAPPSNGGHGGSSGDKKKKEKSSSKDNKSSKGHGHKY